MRILQFEKGMFVVIFRSFIKKNSIQILPEVRRMGVEWVFLDDSAVDLDLDIPCIRDDDGGCDDMEVGMACVNLCLDKFRYILYNAIKLLRTISSCECFLKNLQFA